MISDHSFRGETVCLFPKVSELGEEDFVLCEKPRVAHSTGADDSISDTIPHWFIGLRSCIGCALGFDHPAHYFAPSRRKLVGLR